MRFFGPAKMLKEGEEHVDTPVGVPCVYCNEAIQAGDMGTINVAGQSIHYECGMRSVLGSVAHQLRRCSCYGGEGEDPVGMTVREAAVAAARLYEARLRGARTYKVQTEAGRASITCLRCGSVSHNPGDIENLYCGRCCAPHAAPIPGVGLG